MCKYVSTIIVTVGGELEVETSEALYNPKHAIRDFSARVYVFFLIFLALSDLQSDTKAPFSREQSRKRISDWQRPIKLYGIS